MDFSSNEKRRNNPKRIKHRFDKQLMLVNTTTNNSTTTTTLYPAAVFPSVVMGVVICGSVTTLVNVSTTFVWCLVVVPQGTAVSALSTADGATIYSPETFVMAFGAGTVSSSGPVELHTKTKTGRKINAGDLIRFTMSSTTANIVTWCVAVQFFLKT